MSSDGMPAEVSSPQEPKAADEIPADPITLESESPRRPSLIDRGWRDYATSPWPWRAAGTTNQAGAAMEPAVGEAGGFMVRCEELGNCRAYLKPVRRDYGPGRARAAREKIVSDLAFDVNVAVPPVLLMRRDPCPPNEETFVCVSRVMHPRQWSWHQVKRFVVDPTLSERVNALIMASLPIAAARGLALDAWVDQIDHNDHPHNIIFGYEPGATVSGQFLFLDYAWALGFQLPGTVREEGWQDGRWKNAAVPPFPPHMLRFADVDELDRAITRIERVSDLAIRDIVERVPAPYLESDQKSLIVEGLIGRKALVRPMLQTYLTRTT
jgi:hypothetical protein